MDVAAARIDFTTSLTVYQYQNIIYYCKHNVTSRRLIVGHIIICYI